MVLASSSNPESSSHCTAIGGVQSWLLYSCCSFKQWVVFGFFLCPRVSGIGVSWRLGAHWGRSLPAVLRPCSCLWMWKGNINDGAGQPLDLGECSTAPLLSDGLLKLNLLCFSSFKPLFFFFFFPVPRCIQLLSSTVPFLAPPAPAAGRVGSACSFSYCVSISVAHSLRPLYLLLCSSCSVGPQFFFRRSCLGDRCKFLCLWKRGVQRLPTPPSRTRTLSDHF